MISDYLKYYNELSDIMIVYQDLESYIPEWINIFQDRELEFKANTWFYLQSREDVKCIIDEYIKLLLISFSKKVISPKLGESVSERFNEFIRNENYEVEGFSDLIDINSEEAKILSIVEFTYREYLINRS